MRRTLTNDRCGVVCWGYRWRYFVEIDLTWNEYCALSQYRRLLRRRKSRASELWYPPRVNEDRESICSSPRCGPGDFRPFTRIQQKANPCWMDALLATVSYQPFLASISTLRDAHILVTMLDNFSLKQVVLDKAGPTRSRCTGVEAVQQQSQVSLGSCW